MGCHGRWWIPEWVFVLAMEHVRGLSEREDSCMCELPSSARFHGRREYRYGTHFTGKASLA